MKKTVVFLLILVFMIGCFSGCGTGNTTNSNTSTSENEKSNGSQSNEQASDKSKEETVKLVHWMPGSEEREVQTYTQMHNEFKETVGANVEISFQQVPWSEYFTKLNVAFAGGTAPDIFGLGYGQMGAVQGMGYVMALDDYLKDWDGWEDIPENILAAGTKDGKLYGLLLPEIRALFYRKDLFEEAGLSEPPKTLEELKEYARKLVKKEGDKVVMAGLEIPSTNGEHAYFPFILMSGVSEQMWDEDFQPVFDKPEAIEVLNEMYSYYQEGLTMYSDALDVSGTLFENDLAAMTLNMSTANLISTKEKLGADKIGIAIPPNGLVPMLGTFLCVSAQTKYPEEAVGLFKYMTSTEGMLTIAENVGFIPTRKSCQEDFIALDSEFNEVISELVSRARVYGSMNPYFFDFVEQLRTALEKVYYGKESAETAMTKAAEEYRAKMAESSSN